MTNPSTLTVAIVVTALASTAVLTVPAAHGARILAVETIPAKSHWNFMSAVLRALTDRGHAVTAFTPFLDGDRENYTEIHLSGAMPPLLEMNVFEMREMLRNRFSLMRLIVRTDRKVCQALYDNGGGGGGGGGDRLGTVAAVRRLFADFDAIVVEPGLSGCLSYAAAQTGLPLIHAVPFSTPFFSERPTFGHVPNPAAVSPILADHAVPKTLAHRSSNAATLLYFEIVPKFIGLLLRIFDPNPYEAHAPVSPSLVFTNGHFVSDAPRPIPPNLIGIGGIHLRPANDIPDDILDFIEGSAHGVVLFTFGSTVSISLLPDNVRKAFLDALAVLPQRVLLKYEGELENKPKNVMTRKWLPQRDILLHPNVKVFISHGGICGVYEAVDAGVPVLGFPLFSDQTRNVDHLVEAGMAIAMDVISVTKDEFLENILELVNNESYAKNAKIASDIFKDRPMSQENAVVYWTEYVIRHKGAPHLRSQALNLTWYQYLLLDVIFVIFISIAFVLFVTRRVLRIIYNTCFANYSTNIKTKSE